MSDHAGSGLHYHGYQEKRYGHIHPFLHINHEHEPLSEESIYRRCFECGTEWTAAALVAAHNEMLGGVGAPVVAHVTDPASVWCCPECIHDW